MFSELKRLNIEIGYCLNQLIDCFVNYYLSEFDDYYRSWVNLILRNLNLKIPRQWSLYRKLAFYMLHYIEYNYLLNENDKLNNNSKINSLLNYSENMIVLKKTDQKTIINRQKLNQLKRLLDTFKIIKENKDSRKIIYFMFEILTSLELWKKNIVKDHFKIRFKVDSPKLS